MGTGVPRPGAMPTMDDVQARAERQLLALEDAVRELRGVRGRGAADRDRVIAEVDAVGGLAALRVLPGAGDGDAGNLAAAIVAAAGEAARSAGARRRAITDELFGPAGPVRDTPGETGTAPAPRASNSQAPHPAPGAKQAGPVRSSELQATNTRGTRV